MENTDDEILKDEIDKIAKNIDTIMEKVKNIIPGSQSESAENEE